MEIIKKTVNASPYIGVFCTVTDDVCIVPQKTEKKELEGIGETLGVEVLKTNIANSPLAGIFSVAYKKRLLLPWIAEESEVKFFEDFGLKVKVMEKLSAVGNLFVLNKNAGFASRFVDESAVRAVSKFFGVQFSREKFLESDWLTQKQ